MPNMRPALLKSAAVLALVLGASVAASAAPIAVDFSFTRPSFPPSVIGGKVTGMVDFAGPGTGIAATAVFVTSSPGPGYSPTDNLLTDTNFLITGFPNAFTVDASGNVTSASFKISSIDGSGRYFYLFSKGVGISTIHYNDQTELADFFNQTITFSPVPEPMSAAALIVGVVGLASTRKRRG